MRKLLLGLSIVLLSVSVADAAKKKPYVVIPKPLPAPTLGAIPLAAVPPLLILYDLNRRVNCLIPPDPLGIGGPGFDGKPTPPTNVMIPCYERRALAGRPTPR